MFAPLETTKEKTDINWHEEQRTVYKSGDHYTIYTDGMNFRYTVTAVDGTVLDEGYHSWRGAFDITEQDGLLVLESGTGGNSRSNYRYYDVQKGLVSPSFHNVLAVNGTRVAYIKMKTADSKSVLVVQDVFDSDHGYTEIQRDFAEGTLLYYNTKAVFKNDGAELEITYPYAEATSDTPAQYKTETISLPNETFNEEKDLLSKYQKAVNAYADDPEKMRDVGKKQPETQDVILIDGKHYQTYVAANFDRRYVWVSQQELEMNAYWDWIPIGTADEFSLSNLGKIKDSRK